MGTCDTCHTMGSQDGPRTAYGMLFEEQADHSTNASAALLAIGEPPATNATPAVTETLSATEVPTPVETQEEPPTVTEAPTPVETQEETPTVTEAPTPVETQAETPTVPEATSTPKASGFGIVLSAAGLLVCFVIARRIR